MKIKKYFLLLLLPLSLSIIYLFIMKYNQQTEVKRINCLNYKPENIENSNKLNERWDLLFDGINFKNNEFWEMEAQNKNTIWALNSNSFENILKFNINDASIDEYKFNDNNQFTNIFISNDNQVWGILHEPRLDIDSYSYAFYKYNEKNNEFEFVNHLIFNDEIFHINFSDIEESKDGDFWFIITKNYLRSSSDTILIQFDPITLKMEEFSFEDLKFNEYYSDFISDFGENYSTEIHRFSITSDKKDRLWILGLIKNNDGKNLDDYLLLEINTNHKKIEKIIKIDNFKERFKIPYGTIDIYYDNSNKLWINNIAWIQIDKIKPNWKFTPEVEIYVNPSPFDDYIRREYIGFPVFSNDNGKELWFSGFAGVAIYQQSSNDWCLVSRAGMTVDKYDDIIYGINENGLYQYNDE